MLTPRSKRFTCLALAVLTAATGTAPALAQPKPDPNAPLSSMVALTQRTGRPIPVIVKRFAGQLAAGRLPASAVFPLPVGTAEEIRTISNLGHNVVARWLDPLTPATGADALRYGANNDYIAYFGDGWDADWLGGDVVGSAPQFNGNGKAGWIWSNHEYISNAQPTATSAPTGQHLTFAKFLRDLGVLANDPTAAIWSQADLDTYTRNYKKQLGGSWFRVQFDNATKRWNVVRDFRSQRFDSSSNTLSTVVGHRLRRLEADDQGLLLPPGVVPGIAGDCSGGQTPWGTVITAEENVQDYYGDLEAAWSSNNRLTLGAGVDPGSFINPPMAPSGSAEFSRISTPAGRHLRDSYGYLVEIEPGTPSDVWYLSVDQFGGDGLGHRKIGDFGRARWENATFAVGADFQLVPGQLVTIYAGDDRRSGRIFKWYSKRPYVTGMTKAEVRALLDEGDLYVAHFAGLDNRTGLTLLATGEPPTEASPGQGRWIHLSTTSADLAPNAAALGAPATTVGAALRSVTWNGVGGFRNDNDVRLTLFSAANKIGVMELNRPEDIEWNPRDPSGKARLYVAFTNHARQVALDQDGKLFDPAQHAAASPLRPDSLGAIFAIEEAAPTNPAASKTFKYFTVWQGTEGDGVFDAANPDNIMVDAGGGVWFGTDGNFGRNGHSDAIYYLDLDPAHRAGAPGVVNPTFGKALRIAAVPSDAEATGPAFSSDQATIFLNVQHPGEDFENAPSTWPHDR